MYENICYKNPFIKEAIIRFDFPSEIPNIEKGLPPKVTQAALKLFPIFEPQKMQTHEVQLQLGGDEAKTKITEITNSIFHGLEREKTLSISPNSLYVQIRQYRTFELLLKEIMLPLSALCESFPEIRASRVGIRYVNILNIGEENPLDWSKYINPKLLAITDFNNKENLSRAFQIIEYNFEEDSLKFQAGIANPDYPAKIKQRQFVLDLDASSVGAYDFQEMIAKVKVGHERIQDIFESSITDATRAAMRVVKDDAGH